jgi:FkbM family methyltransferase
MAISSSAALRRLVLPLLRKFNPGDISIRHHWTGDRFRLHSFHHRGYWFYGRKREQQTMRWFQRNLRRGDCVIDVGTHIGYLSLYFFHLIGEEGHVYSFEPSAANLAYARHNLAGKTGITLVEKGLGKESGTLQLYVDDVTGQNTSFVPDYLERFPKDDVHCMHVTVSQEAVEVVTLDGFLAERQIQPDFIKIDVEGFEHEVLQGGLESLKSYRPALMIELQMNREDVLQLLQSLEYRVVSPEGRPILGVGDLERQVMNVFCTHPARPWSTPDSTG